MGFATETRARRFLEARRKPLKLVAKEKAHRGMGIHMDSPRCRKKMG
jgi:hypothetical protein